MSGARNEYYNKILIDNRNYIKHTWKILNGINGNKPVSTGLPSHFINDNNKVLEKTNEVVNEFNTFL